MPPAALQDWAPARRLDPVLNREAISIDSGNLQKNVMRIVHIMFIKSYSQMKQMKIDSQEKAEGKNANKCSLGRLHDFFSAFYSLCLSITKIAFGHSISSKSLCKHF